MELIEVSRIQVDPNNPRKNFDAGKMSSLRKSIDKHGIKNPVTVTPLGKGAYMLLDGERRFRAAQELGLKKVPTIIDEPTSETDRMIIQFNIQEQHAEWSPLEKAMAITNLADKLGGSISEICEMLGMGKHDKELFTAFAGLADKAAYVRNEVPLERVKAFQSISNLAKKISRNELEEEFTKQDQKALEHALIRSVKDGSIQDNKDIVRLKDAFNKNPKLITEYIENDKATPDGMFIKAKAKSAYYLRNLVTQTSFLVNNCRRFLEQPDVKVTVDELQKMRSAYDALGDVIKYVD